MSDSDWIKALGATIVATLGAVIVLAERLWKAKRANSSFYDLSSVKRERAFREEIFKLMDRKEKDYDEMKEEFVQLAKDHLNCATQLAAVRARLDFAEEQLDKLMFKDKEPETVVDIRKKPTG